MLKLFSPAAAAVVLGLMMSPANAAPAGSLANGLKEVTPATSAVEQIASRRCWRKNGRTYCRRTVRRYQDQGYYGYREPGPSIGVYVGSGSRDRGDRGRHRRDR